MTNDLVAQAQLPSYLAVLQQNSALKQVGAGLAAMANGEAHPRISIKGSRFRLQDSNGEETVIQQLYLDVVIVDANPNNSKIYYIGAYNPQETEFKAPDCFSDNGIAPSARSTAPQCGTCAACPHNVWGSKVTPNGSQTKACADSRKLAVIIADNPDGPVFELKVPAASIKNLVNYAKQLDQRGIPIPGVVTRLEFDSQSDFPKLAFKPSGWATEAQVSAVQELIGSSEVNACIGKEDKPMGAVPLTNAPIPAVQASIPVAAPAKPVDPFDALGALPVQAQSFPTPQPLAEKQKRTRKRAEAAPVAQMDIPLPPNAAAQAVPVDTPKTTDALDDLISQALKY